MTAAQRNRLACARLLEAQDTQAMLCKRSFVIFSTSLYLIPHLFATALGHHPPLQAALFSARFFVRGQRAESRKRLAVEK